MKSILPLILTAIAGPVFAGLPLVFVPPAGAIRELADGDSERDPAKLAARIGKNARAAGDLLAARDTGSDTRRTQADILRDIDRLLEQANDSPPPPSGGGGEGEPPPPQGADQPPPPGGGQPPPGGGQPPPQGGQAGQKPGGQPPGQGAPKPPGQDAPGGQPMPQGAGEPQPADGKPGEAKPGGAAGGQQGAPPRRPAPPEDAIAKQVWGHLPEKLRREMNQYYKEQFMPKYGDLLRDYYSGLADAARPAGRD